MPVLTVHAPFLPPAARAEVADRAASFAAGETVRVLRVVDALAHHIAQLAEQLVASPTPGAHLVELALSEAQLLVHLRAARVYAEAAGSHLPASAAERLNDLKELAR